MILAFAVSPMNLRARVQQKATPESVRKRRATRQPRGFWKCVLEKTEQQKQHTGVAIPTLPLSPQLYCCRCCCCLTSLRASPCRPQLLSNTLCPRQAACRVYREPIKMPNAERKKTIVTDEQLSRACQKLDYSTTFGTCLYIISVAYHTRIRHFIRLGTWVSVCADTNKLNAHYIKLQKNQRKRKHCHMTNSTCRKSKTHFESKNAYRKVIFFARSFLLYI